MKKTIGIYEAKTSLSKLIKAVKSGRQSFQISERGKPVALLSPIRDNDCLESHMEEMVQSGIIDRAEKNEIPQSVASRKGALRRFLEDRE